MVPRSALQALLEAAKLVRSNDISASSGNSFKGRETSKLSLVGGQKSPTPASGTITLNRIPGSMIWHGQASNSEADLAKVIEASNSETDPGKEIEASNSEADPAKEIVADKHYCYSKASIQCTSQPTGSVSQESELLQMMTEAPQETQMSSSMSEVLIEDHLDAEGTSSNSISAVSHRPSSVESVKDQHALIYLATSPISYIDATPRLAAPMSFFDSCQLCKHPLGPGRDIFMYRGENAFCSSECRDKQMRLEEMTEKLQCMYSQMHKQNVKNANCNDEKRVSRDCNHQSDLQPHKQHYRREEYMRSPVNQYSTSQHRRSLLMRVA
ncbi:hypothetical protein KP509_19G048500 [Ceratopteris richardii]|uniref:FLZ-type domain-containing protein n=1 Tax=Ceratopteris richardii TaxID=49495 RepID=A0A8T2SNU5_CERRI|nr:hypothetical protein KP509_19G048500 [Ceratopteris richardii]